MNLEKSEPELKQIFDFIGYQFSLKVTALHIPDRFTNSHRKASSPRQTPHETNTVASQKQLANTRKSDPNSQVHALPFTMVARRRQRSLRPTLTPNKVCSPNLYRPIKRRVGRSLKQAHCKRNLVPSRKQAAYKLPRRFC